jgi:hypothetical protein
MIFVRFLNSMANSNILEYAQRCYKKSSYLFAKRILQLTSSGSGSFMASLLRSIFCQHFCKDSNLEQLFAVGWVAKVKNCC